MDTRVNHVVEVVRYTLPARHRHDCNLEPSYGFLCLDYSSPDDNSKIEIDVVDLKRGTLFRFAMGASIFGV